MNLNQWYLMSDLTVNDADGDTIQAYRRRRLWSGNIDVYSVSQLFLDGSNELHLPSLMISI